MAKSRIIGVKALSAKLKRLAPESVQKVGAAAYVAADLVSTDAAISITTGAVSGKAHVPSAPGSPPNADTHLLDRSIHVEKSGPLSARVVADAPYAAAQELGTSKLPERPYLRPALAKNKQKALALMSAAVKQAAKK